MILRCPMGAFATLMDEGRAYPGAQPAGRALRPRRAMTTGVIVGMLAVAAFAALIVTAAVCG